MMLGRVGSVVSVGTRTRWIASTNTTPSTSIISTKFTWTWWWWWR